MNIPGTNPPVMDVKECQGTENNIYDCDYELGDNLKCDANKILTVSCNKHPDSSESKLIKNIFAYLTKYVFIIKVILTIKKEWMMLPIFLQNFSLQLLSGVVT